MRDAPKDGTTILAYFPSRGWFFVKWGQPEGCIAHWCINGQWTPGTDPVCWMPATVPQEPPLEAWAPEDGAVLDIALEEVTKPRRETTPAIPF